MDNVQTKLLTAAITSGDAYAYLDTLLTMDPEDNNGIDKGDAERKENQPPGDGTGEALPAVAGGPGLLAGAHGFGGGEGAATVNQEKVYTSKLLKDVVNSCLFHLYGDVDRLKPERIGYPYGLTPQDPGWPAKGKGPGRRAYIQFDLTKPHNDPINEQPLKEWCKFEQAQQAAQQIQDKQEGSTGSDTADDGTAHPAKKKKTAGYQTRTLGKMHSRSCRMEKLPPDAPYTQMQQDTMATPGAQSQDKTEYEDMADGTRRKTKNFISRPWSFLSNEFVAMKKAVDEIEDPDPPRGYQKRIPGPPREGPPPRNNLNKYLLHRWMPAWSPKSNVKKRKPQSNRQSVPKSELRKVCRKLVDGKGALAANLDGQTIDKLQEDLDFKGDEEELGAGGFEGSDRDSRDGSSEEGE
ncbi:hypothetical protein FRC07_004749 [Ceratobasidium sp. 392]|nr:hypothetical protein FRC07_004749 [Ceratobasidium sp. 392]